MTPRPTPHDFLLHLRGAFPALARRFDGITGLSLAGDVLAVRAPGESWSGAELAARRGELERAAAGFFGPATRVALESGPPDPERLPFPVLASKTWNHVAFWTPGPAGSPVVAVRKTAYLERWLPAGAVVDAPGEEAFRREYPGDSSPEEVLPGLLDDLCALVREKMSYVQLVAAFPGDAAADRLEGRLYAVKEWGTPRTPPAILHKYVGRLHYADPERPPLGLRLLKSPVATGCQA